MRFGAVGNEIDPPGPNYDKETGTITMSLDQFIELVGLGSGNDYLIAQNIGMVPAHFILTFTDLEP